MESKIRTGGFASMDQHKQREIARKGGMAAHRKGTAHEFTAQEARDAGRKGGQQVSANRSHMIEIGRLGGRRSAERRRNKSNTERVGGGSSHMQPGTSGAMASHPPTESQTKSEGTNASESLEKTVSITRE